MTSSEQLALLSLGYLTLPQSGPAEIIEAAAAAALTRCGLRVGGRLPDDDGYWAARDPALRRELRARADALGVRVHNVAAHYTGPDTTADDFLPVFETAAELGAQFVCTSGYDADEARLAATLANVAERASRYHLTVALEFVPYSELRTIEAARRVVAATAAANVRILVDAMHLMRSGGTVAAVTGLPADYLAFAQLCDGPAEKPLELSLAEEARSRRLLPGEGVFPLADLVRAVSPNTALEIETPVARLRELPPGARVVAAATAVRKFLQTLSE